MIEHLQHTADVRVRVSAPSPEALYAEALRALFEVMSPVAKDSSAAGRTRIRIESPDPTSLLVDFLNEVLWRASVEQARFDLVRFMTHSGSTVEAELLSIPVSSFSDDVKAVTYHEADVRRNDRGEWETILVFDV